MRNELLIEIFSEEIPARLQKQAISDSKFLFSKILNNYGAEFSDIETYVSPRRIAIRVIQLNEKTVDISEEKRGPRISAPSKSIDGFLNANNKFRSDLIEKDGYYYLNIEKKGVYIKDIIGLMIEDFISNMPWQKSMRWYIEEERTLSAFWVRPIRSILCIFGGNTIESYIKSVGITTGNYTYGHRFLSPNKIVVSNFNDYIDKLEKNYILLDFFQKRELIRREIDQKASDMGLCVKTDSELLDEVAGLVEYPFVHIGSINEKFMSLPPIVLSTSMKVHQKYFTLTYPDSIIAPFFATVTNVLGSEVMYEGLERVLRARLSDAMFFFKEDVNVTLEAYAQRLSSVVFHEKLGSIAQKIDRMMSVANTKKEHRAIALCKADLMSQMVGEFPELQGIMGEIYAKEQGETQEICQAIREHYKPSGSNDSMPTTKTGARIAFFDKLDTLVGFLGVGIYPTGSKDPFALRRSALCIVRLICDFGKELFDEESLTWYIKTLSTAYSDQGVALDVDIVNNVETFIIKHLKGYMTDKLEIPADIVESVISSYDTLDFDYKASIIKAHKLCKLSAMDNFQIVKDAYKRASGVVTDIIKNEISIQLLDFANLELTTLKSAIIKMQNAQDDYNSYVEASKAILSVCDNVLINDPDDNIKTKNLCLISTYINIIRERLGVLS